MATARWIRVMENLTPKTSPSMSLWNLMEEIRGKVIDPVLPFIVGFANWVISCLGIEYRFLWFEDAELIEVLPASGADWGTAYAVDESYAFELPLDMASTETVWRSSPHTVALSMIELESDERPLLFSIIIEEVPHDQFEERAEIVADARDDYDPGVEFVPIAEQWDSEGGSVRVTLQFTDGEDTVVQRFIAESGSKRLYVLEARMPSDHDDEESAATARFLESFTVRE
jgi:hypothetical protein